MECSDNKLPRILENASVEHRVDILHKWVLFLEICFVDGSRPYENTKGLKQVLTVTYFSLINSWFVVMG